MSEKIAPSHQEEVAASRDAVALGVTGASAGATAGVGLMVAANIVNLIANIAAPVVGAILIGGAAYLLGLQRARHPHD
jgi:formate/nitrite transporter FocA (FNT family)